MAMHIKKVTQYILKEFWGNRQLDKKIGKGDLQIMIKAKIISFEIWQICRNEELLTRKTVHEAKFKIYNNSIVK